MDMKLTRPDTSLPGTSSARHFDRDDMLTVPILSVCAYLFVRMGFCASMPAFAGLFAAFTFVYTLLVLFTRGEHAHPKEHILWLICTWISVGSFCGNLLGFRSFRVWSDSILGLVIPVCFGAYWALSVSGTLCDRVSSRFLPIDAVNALFIVPFGHFLDSFRVIAQSLRERRSVAPSRLLYAACASVTAFLLFIGAGSLLISADTGFRALLSRIDPGILLPDAQVIMTCLVLSVPVAMYLNGLVIGARYAGEKEIPERRDAVSMFLRRLNRVPSCVWTMLVFCFILLYGLFFGVQGSYLFSALRGIVPNGFSVASYAVKGFSELCLVAGINFLLMWLVYVSAEDHGLGSAAGRATWTVLLCETLLLAVTAGAKLYLYLRVFGFTPLRIQGAWMISVISAGCVCTLIRIHARRDTSRFFIYFCGVTLAATMLI